MNEIIVYSEGRPQLKKSLLDVIIETEDKLQELTNIRDNYRELILKAMEEKGLTDLNNEILGVYIHYNEKKENQERFDKTKLRNLEPEKYDEYVTFDGVKNAYISIRRK